MAQQSAQHVDDGSLFGFLGGPSTAVAAVPPPVSSKDKPGGAMALHSSQPLWPV